MKQVTIVGCDGKYLKSIRYLLSGLGYSINKHVEGRHRNAQHKSTAVIPPKTDLVIVFIDYISHNIKYNFSVEAKKLGIPVIYCVRSVTQLRGKLECLNKKKDKQAMTCA